ncbi:hypothetical protein M431DRAFT_419486 [Trichoderma harzianum CBS 226.95]|uniref:Uncharacterized protein n=1 Tax=Trichoderma harzianum CBS 226.95 TaxID=983964 RepID=A0A2T4AGN0_TRIHA|nr:hypothetical protein M431DRAFT_419486 [Trichoderma harzianum CBS 226.95]PTB56162.1 hypothetical protein M431DRAFT_419486 [Trichoderma harzianum CBS 226.95]
MGPCFLLFSPPPFGAGRPSPLWFPKTFFFFESFGVRFWAGLLNVVGEPSITFFVLGCCRTACLSLGPYFFILVI